MGLIDRRIGLLFAVFLVLLAFAGMRSAWLGTVRADSLKEAAATQQVQEVTVPARRGSILDRNGEPLAISEPADDIAATPYLIADAPGTADKLAKILGLPDDELLRKLSLEDTGFVYLARGVPADVSEKVKDLEIEGIDFIPTSLRTYPRDYLASQLLGTVGTEGEGLAGLEYAADDLLHGQDGTRRLTQDAIGQPIGVDDPVPSLPGKDLTLTLDSAIQSKVEAVLGGVGQVYQPKGAT
ncbi:MAG TPA: hypothetical protein VIL49_04765, partial [Capillimicrobium sp.]